MSWRVARFFVYFFPTRHDFGFDLTVAGMNTAYQVLVHNSALKYILARCRWTRGAFLARLVCLFPCISLHALAYRRCRGAVCPPWGRDTKGRSGHLGDHRSARHHQCGFRRCPVSRLGCSAYGMPVFASFSLFLSFLSIVIDSRYLQH